MRINHNISALEHYNQVKAQNKKSISKMEKLSSGLRINRASDDSAGLAISEKMRAQIRGLQQTERNIQDGISLIQVADGAIGEIQDINQRMRELTLQGSNDTLTDQDRDTIQVELDQLKKGIEYLSQNTVFNTINLLDGSKEIQRESTPKIPLAFEWKVDFDKPIQLTTMVATTDGGIIVGGTSDQWASHHTLNDRSPYLAKLNSLGEVEWELKIPKDGEYNTIYDIKRINNSEEYIITSRSYVKESNDVYSNYNIFYKITEDGAISSKLDAGYTNYSFSIQQSDDGTFIETGLGGSSLFVRTYDSQLNATQYKVYPSYGNIRSGLDIKKTSDGGFILAGSENDSGTRNGLLMKLKPDLTVEWEKVIPNDGFASVVEIPNGEFMVLGEKLYKFDPFGNQTYIDNNIGYKIDPFLLSSGNIIETQDNNYLISLGKSNTSNQIVKIDVNGNKIWNISLDEYNFHMTSVVELENGDYVALGENEVFKYTNDRPISKDEIDPTIFIQIGANGGQPVGINIEGMKPSDLGFTDGIPSVITNEAVALSIEKIDKAIEKVSRSRSTLGALHNGLEHSLSNAMNYKENLSSAESRIRDLDIAQEVMEQTKYSLLTQIAQTMLAQINQKPEEVLQLLK